MTLIRVSISAWKPPFGLRVSANDTISNVHAGSAAEKAGFKIGDEIVSVDDIDIVRSL